MLDFIEKISVKQAIVIILFVFAAVFLIFFLKNKLTDAIEEYQDSQKQKEFEKKINAVENAQKEQVQSDISFSNSEYTQMADAIHEAFNDLGTDEDKIAGVFSRLKTKTDFLKLVEFFGERTISTGWFWLTVTGNMYQLLEYELTQSDKDELNEILRRIDVQL